MAEDSAYKPRFVALEDNEEWLDYHERNFPPSLRPLVEMLWIPAVTSETREGLVARYERIPTLPFDFIHVDGPSNISETGFLSDDVSRIRNCLNPSCHIVFDGRTASARLAARSLSGFRHWRNPWTLNHEFVRGFT